VRVTILTRLQDKVAEIEESYVARLEQRALFVLRQAETGGTVKTTSFHRGVSKLFLLIRVVLIIYRF